MIRVLSLAAIAALSIATAQAQTQNKAKAQSPEPQADCRKFQRMSDGRWTSTVESKVGNPKSFVTLQPGIPIDRKLTVVGINVSDTIDALCGGK